MNSIDKEKEILEFWKKEKIFQKTLEKTKKGEPYIFYDGPITVNAQPGIHHVEARIYKDIIPRFKTMQGFYVKRKSGWDTHGLPVELMAEQKLGFKAKKDIENFGIAKFNQECKKIVNDLLPIFKNLTDRIAYWIDMDNPYITYKSEYIETLWWIFKQIWNKKLLYEDFKVVPWCSRCGTVLSSHELAQGYQKVTETSVYIKLKLKKAQKIKNTALDQNTYLLSWTTTPWTLPGNVALAVNPAFTYCLIKVDKEKFILAKNRLEVLDTPYEILKEFQGKELKELSYEPIFNIKELQKKSSYKVYEADFVTQEEGTGIVHTAVMYGADDFELGKKYDLPQIHTVTEQGKFNTLVKDFENLDIKNEETEKKLKKYLIKNNILLKEEKITHDYPFCWRCKKPLIYYAKKSWFIKMTALQKELLQENAKINWMPAHLKEGRFGEWLKEVKDWAISRERYWGTPLPVWKCQSKDCNNTHIIGSFEELEKLSGQKITDPHRPMVDEITFKCSKCGGTMKREPYVADVWFDSGSMPFAQYHFPFDQKEDINKLPFPADYISEAIDQTRGWFYTLLAVSVLLGYKTPYKNVLCLGHVKDKKGEKMSKSKGNIVDPIKILDQYGTDALRWYFFTINQPNDSKQFDKEDVKKSFRKLLVLKNSFNFLQFYHNKVFTLRDLDFKPSHILDQWLLARYEQISSAVTDQLNNYEVVKASRLLQNLIDDISYNYIQWSRDRFKDNNNEPIKTLLRVFLGLSKLLAPFVPFLSEDIYQTLKKNLFSDSKHFKASVHLENWPKEAKITQKEQAIFSKIATLQDIIALSLRARKEANIKVRQPLEVIQVNLASFDPELTKIIQQKINVKKVIFNKNIKKKEGWLLDQENNLKVLLKTDISDNLKKEGLLREIVRHIQRLRKKADLKPEDKILLTYQGTDNQLIDIIQNNKDYLEKTSGIKELRKVANIKEKQHLAEINLPAGSIKISLKVL
jgi:isoleucyl-tRNA synthetase